MVEEIGRKAALTSMHRSNPRPSIEGRGLLRTGEGYAAEAEASPSRTRGATSVA
jgi:hypothetical protein